MAEITKLYQIGGFRGHTPITFGTQGFISKLHEELAKQICPSKGGIDLILGVLPSGASYLLLPEREFVGFFRRPHRPRDGPSCWYPSDFRSLSPVYFTSRDELARKLKMFNAFQKKDKTRDRSKVNTPYSSMDNNELTAAGIERSNFEHQRVFLQLCRGEIHPSHYGHYGLQPSSSLEKIRVISFSFNLWNADERTFPERQRDPKILDVGWTEYSSPSSSKILQPKTTVHIKIQESASLRNQGGKSLDFKHGVSETLKKGGVATRLQQLLAKTDEGACAPVILLVHNEEITKTVLLALGAETTRWSSAIDSILGTSYSSGSGHSRQGGVSYAVHSHSRYGSNHHRERSLSPPRGSSSRDPRRRPSPLRSLSSHIPPVSIVDVRSMYAALRQQSLRTSDTIYQYASDLRVGGGPSERGWCAGNESRILGTMWETMASGNAIDEQRSARWESATMTGDIKPEDTKPELPVPSSSSTKDVAHDDDSDSESDYDPNNVVPTTSHATVVAAAPTAGNGDTKRATNVNIYDDDDDSDDDYNNVKSRKR